MRKIISVCVLDGYRLELVFDDQERGVVDLSADVGKGVFSLWQEYHVFRNVEVGSSGELRWGDAVDLCADALYLQATGKKPEDLFPELRRENVNA